jgi:hypothetical protein
MIQGSPRREMRSYPCVSQSTSKTAHTSMVSLSPYGVEKGLFPRHQNRVAASQGEYPYLYYVIPPLEMQLLLSNLEDPFLEAALPRHKLHTKRVSDHGEKYAADGPSTFGLRPRLRS